jgi:hypothetical protein
MNTKIILASIITAATLAACSSPNVLNLEDVGAQPTLEELNADNDSSLELSGSTGGLGNLLVRKVYDSNQNGKYDDNEPGIPDWGVRIVSVDENGNPDDAADVQVTPWGSGRWRGVNLKVPFGRYKIEELEPSATQAQGTGWKVTGKPSRTVNVSRSNPLRAIEFAGVCLENGAVVAFPKQADFGDWKCRASFDLLPRIGSFTATPAQIQPGGSSVLKWNVLDYSKLEITPTVGVLKGFTGSKNVTPSSTTAYTLKATNGFGSRTASVTVNVGSIMKWQTPQVLIPSRVGLTTVELFKNNQGQLMAVTSYMIPGTNTSELMVATYSAAQGWSSFVPVALLPYASGNPSIRASVAANGDTFVSYSPTEAFEKTVLVFRRPNGGNWDAGSKLPLGFVIPNGGPGIDFAAVIGQLKTDSFGNAFFLASGCLQAGGFKQNCQKTATRVVRYTPATGWSAPTELVVNAGNTQQNPLLSVAANGNALSVWTDVPTATDNGFRYASFTPNAGWQAPRAVDVGTPKFLSHTANGQAILISQGLISQGLISQGGSLLCRTVIAPALGTADCINLVPINPNSAVAMNSKGEVMAVVASNPSFITDNPFTNNLRPTELFAIRYLPGTGWGVPQALVSGRQDGLNLISNPSDSFNTVSINENAVAFVGTAIFDKVTPDQGPTSTFTNVSIRLAPNSEQAGTPEPIWAASSSQAQIFPDGLEVLPDNSAVAVGIAAEFSANGIPVPALLSNTYR